jgi:hypothetical protein
LFRNPSRRLYMPVTEQDYRNIVAKMRVDPLFRSLVIQIVRENLDVIAAPMIREIEGKIGQASAQKRQYY